MCLHFLTFSLTLYDPGGGGGLKAPPLRFFCPHAQWCSGKFSLVGTLTWHYGHIPYCYRGGGGGCLNKWSFFKGKNLCSN